MAKNNDIEHDVSICLDLLYVNDFEFIPLHLGQMAGSTEKAAQLTFFAEVTPLILQVLSNNTANGWEQVLESLSKTVAVKPFPTISKVLVFVTLAGNTTSFCRTP